MRGVEVVGADDATQQTLTADTLQSVQDTGLMDDLLVEQGTIDVPLMGPAPAATHQRRLFDHAGFGGGAVGAWWRAGCSSKRTAQPNSWRRQANH